MTVVTALLFHSGDVAATCTIDQQQGYWSIAGRCISINETLYLGTLNRAGGLLLGAAFALLWRPSALPPQVRNKPHTLDAVGLLGLVGLGWLAWRLWLSEGGRQFGIRFDPLLFRGGFLVTDIATLAVIAAVAHQRSWLGRLLGTPVFNWVGTRSYGLYLFHWPIYQIIRGEAGQPLRPAQFALAMLLTLPIAEASYRFIELPIRQGRLSEGLRDRRRRSAAVYQRRRRVVGVLLAVAALVGFASVSIALAPNKCVGQVECDLAAATATTGSSPPSDSSPIDTVASTQTDGTATAQTLESTTSSSSTTSTTLPVDQRPPYRHRRVGHGRRHTAVGSERFHS